MKSETNTGLFILKIPLRVRDRIRGFAAYSSVFFMLLCHYGDLPFAHCHVYIFSVAELLPCKFLEKLFANTKGGRRVGKKWKQPSDTGGQMLFWTRVTPADTYVVWNLNKYYFFIAHRVFTISPLLFPNGQGYNVSKELPSGIVIHIYMCAIIEYVYGFMGSVVFLSKKRDRKKKKRCFDIFSHRRIGLYVSVCNKNIILWIKIRMWRRQYNFHQILYLRK